MIQNLIWKKNVAELNKWQNIFYFLLFEIIRMNTSWNITKVTCIIIYYSHSASWIIWKHERLYIEFRSKQILTDMFFIEMSLGYVLNFNSYTLIFISIITQNNLFIIYVSYNINIVIYSSCSAYLIAIKLITYKNANILHNIMFYKQNLFC